MTVNEIKAPIEKEMEEFELKFKTSMKSSVPLLDKITHYIVKRKGKQLRPMFVFLSAKACGEMNESTYRACGAASVTADEKAIEQMRAFGEAVGIAFQIKDDLFDYGDGINIGKPTGIDIKEKKMTLPLIYALNNSSSIEKRRIINIVKN